MRLVAIGVNHHTAPLNVREAVWLSTESSIAAARGVRGIGMDEAFVLSTCNRTEIYAVKYQDPGMEAMDRAVHDATDVLLSFARSRDLVRKEHLFLLHDYHALRHVFRVATGTDSMVVGDMQILGQFKEAAFAAEREGLTGSFLHHIVEASLHAAKRARSETALMEGAVSISYAAVELAGKIFSDLSGRRVLLVGAGQTGELAARHFVAKGVTRLSIANRTRSKAEELAAELAGRVVDYESVDDELAAADVVLTSVSSDDPIFTAERLRRVMKRRRNAPLVLVDIGVPRNVEPSASSLDFLFLYDIDSLQVVVEQNRARRETELPKVNAIIREELREFKEWAAAQEAKPLIVDLRNHFESVRSQVVEQHRHRFTAEQQEIVEMITRRIIQRLLHLPTTELRNGTDLKADERRHRTTLVRRLFGLLGDQGMNSRPTSDDRVEAGSKA
jgi:glutamyl-tRNA reductase